MKTCHITKIGIEIDSKIHPILSSLDSPTGVSSAHRLSLNSLGAVGLVGAVLLTAPVLKADTLDSCASPLRIELSSIENPTKTSDAKYGKAHRLEYRRGGSGGSGGRGSSGSGRGH